MLTNMPVIGTVRQYDHRVGFVYHHLNEADVRVEMVAAWREEWADLSANWPRGQCYGKQLTDTGWITFERVMPEALATQDDDWLVAEMSPAEYWQDRLARRTKTGVTMVDYNKRDALEKLCLGEFNIAYIRGLARALIARGETTCMVYRANPAYVPRGECSSWEEQTFTLTDVIAGHRARYHPPPGDRLAWSIPSGPSCHHSIRSVASSDQ
ncbi:MAG: hypothetical protein WAU77_06075 [Solirubrobacteraceae bacterium]